MLAEHLVYTAAIAVIAGMLFFRYTGRDVSWIVILVAYVPDLDKVLGGLLWRLGISVYVDGIPIHHGTFHTLFALVIFSIALAFLFNPLGIRFLDTLVFTGIGFGAHLLEDALVYSSNYMYLWPLSREKIGLGWLNGSEETYNASFFHIANAEVLAIGLVLLLLAVLARTRVEGPGWIRWYMPRGMYAFLIGRGTPEKEGKSTPGDDAPTVPGCRED